MADARSRRGSRRPPSDHPDYAIGYGKPPMASRFKPGRSGNPKGRPRRRLNLRTVLEEALNQRITIREGERSRLLTKREALILTVVNNALKCEPKALASLITLMRALGMADEPPPPSRSEPVTDQDESLLADFLARNAVPSSRTSTSESLDLPPTRKPPVEKDGKTSNDGQHR